MLSSYVNSRPTSEVWVLRAWRERHNKTILSTLKRSRVFIADIMVKSSTHSINTGSHIFLRNRAQLRAAMAPPRFPYHDRPQPNNSKLCVVHIIVKPHYKRSSEIKYKK